MSRKTFTLILVALVAAVSACTIPGATPPATEPPPPQTPTNKPILIPATTPTSLPALNIDRIGIRTTDGKAEFYDTGSGETFTVRGVNYVELVETERVGRFEDRIMATNRYDPEKVRADFQHLAELGYNTVRIFFDTCGFGPNCIGNTRGSGLNPNYLDNMADLMQIAGEEGLYIIFTANSVPESGGYWPYFDQQINEDNVILGFESFHNADWLHPAGVEIKRRFWHDLMSGMADRSAPFETVLGWQLTNEFWLFKNYPPLSLDAGLVTTANGQSYDMADPDQKRQMVIDGTLYFMEEIIPIIKQYDPEALTTMGFFAPQFPNDTYIGGDWYVDTAPLIETAPIDFWDLHAYYDTDLTIQQQAENFGIIGYEAKPVILGETGAGIEVVPSAATALTAGVQWYTESCQYNFDGWLYWGYYPWPEAMTGAPWAALAEDELILKSMAPVNWPDVCTPPELAISNIAYQRPTRASRSLPGEPSSNAVDGTSLGWNAGNYPPQWIEIELDEPSTIQRVAMTTQQWPPGITRHQVWARLDDGKMVLLGQHDEYTTVDMNLIIQLPIPLENVAAVRIETEANPSWVGWREIEVISAPDPAETACIAAAAGSPPMLAAPVDSDTANGLLAPGTLIYINGYTENNGTTYWQTGGGQWIEEEYLNHLDECTNSTVELESEPRLVPVTIQVTVPADTSDEIFLAGDFEGLDVPKWLPYSILLTRINSTTFEVTIPLPVGAEIAYKYTRGSWETVEKGNLCTDPPNHTYTVTDSEAITINDEILFWADLAGCN